MALQTAIKRKKGNNMADEIDRINEMNEFYNGTHDLMNNKSNHHEDISEENIFAQVGLLKGKENWYRILSDGNKNYKFEKEI